MVLSVCEWGTNQPWTWGADIGAQLWRTTEDIVDCHDCRTDWGGMGWVHILDLQVGLEQHAGHTMKKPYPNVQQLASSLPEGSLARTLCECFVGVGSREEAEDKVRTVLERDATNSWDSTGKATASEVRIRHSARIPGLRSRAADDRVRWAPGSRVGSEQ